METNNNVPQLDSLIENGRKAMERYLINLGRQVYCLSPLNPSFSSISSNLKIKALIESGQKSVTNYCKEKVSSFCVEQN